VVLGERQAFFQEKCVAQECGGPAKASSGDTLGIPVPETAVLGELAVSVIILACPFDHTDL